MTTADVIFTGGPIFTGSGDPIQGYAVTVTGDRITGLISASEIDLYRGAETQVIDLDGALLSPGFQDAHIHPTSGGVELLQCDLSGTESAEEAVARIAAYAAANPEVEWISGGGWSMDHFPGGNPPASLIDAVVPDRPVTVMSRDHHSLWANGAAIRAAGLDAATPDPEDALASVDDVESSELSEQLLAMPVGHEQRQERPVDLPFAEPPIGHAMQWYRVAGRGHPCRDSLLRLLDLHALILRAVKSCPLGRGVEDVVREHVDVLPTRAQQRPPYLRGDHGGTQLGVRLSPAEGDGCRVAPWTERNAAAGEHGFIGVKFTDRIDGLPRSEVDPDRFAVGEEVIEV
ncbi:MAG: hypothetical protein DI566_10910 [Microbacterium sp.]|nr:MAG: hypothetical protein DI566_10910 [Microbacterium sp.]